MTPHPASAALILAREYAAATIVAMIHLTDPVAEKARADLGKIDAAIAALERAPDVGPSREAENLIGAAELEVGRYIYARLEKLMDAKPDTPEGRELAYLGRIVSDVEEYGATGDEGGESPERDALKERAAWALFLGPFREDSEKPAADAVALLPRALEEMSETIVRAPSFTGLAGWKLVPRDPTEEMVATAGEAWTPSMASLRPKIVREVWEKLYDAAPETARLPNPSAELIAELCEALEDDVATLEAIAEIDALLRDSPTDKEDWADIHRRLKSERDKRRSALSKAQGAAG